MSRQKYSNNILKISHKTNSVSTLSAVNKVTRVWDGLSGIQIPAETRDLSQLQNVQRSSGAHEVSYAVNAGDFFPRSSSGVDVKLTTHLHLLLTLEMSAATRLLPLHGVDRDKLSHLRLDLIHMSVC
jgi:hypothetical protein